MLLSQLLAQLALEDRDLVSAEPGSEADAEQPQPLRATDASLTAGTDGTFRDDGAGERGEVESP